MKLLDSELKCKIWSTFNIFIEYFKGKFLSVCMFIYKKSFKKRCVNEFIQQII